MRKLRSLYLLLRWKFLGGNKLFDEYAKRRNTVVSMFLAVREDEMEPWVMDGKWSWNALNGVAYPITLVFPERPLVVHVLGPEIGDWDKRKRFCYDKKSWELANQIVSNTIIILKELHIPFIIIGWDEPVSEESIRLKLKEIENGRI